MTFLFFSIAFIVLLPPDSNLNPMDKVLLVDAAVQEVPGTGLTRRNYQQNY